MKEQKIPVSVIIMTKNEEKDLPKCLASVQWFSEIFVVDSNSSDKTVEIAKSLNAKVLPFCWNGRYPKKKQWCLENLPFSHDWVFYLDADEEAYPELSEEISTLMRSQPSCEGYFAKFDYVFLGKTLRFGHLIYKLVLFNRRKGHFEEKNDLEAANAGEVELHFQPTIVGRTAVLKNRIRHEDCDSLYHYFERHNRYSDWEAVLRLNHGLLSEGDSQTPLRRFQKKIFNLLPYKWLVAFFHSYILKLGFLDGGPGFHYALARAFYYWQIEVKMYEKSKGEDIPFPRQQLKIKSQ